MQKRGETQKGFVIALLLVLVAVVGVSYLSSSGSTGKAVSTVDGEASAGEDVCPNPKSSEKACVGNVLCYYKCKEGENSGRWFHLIVPSSGECPSHFTSFCSFSSSLRIDGNTCPVARLALQSREPGSCSTNCKDTGVLEFDEKDAECCIAIKERNCVPSPDVR